eukprot:Protomagalhaensia_sp_Gyna_25__3279@NODE_297_length_4017_cov_72_141780_g229_i0_p4_GENE_NODE_297_length_4017_cov_72_141780_g229_i0NODE_297_length_4017_cov_72_141780_g229_i0_p4_ORF_typecomplete_len144_score18_99Integrin_b_cyt/PF08725_11/2_1Integrin_b_cyt/PF08725_11/3e02_NODE_297_length_4017_cov_72_141780_g229_i015591990
MTVQFSSTLILKKKTMIMMMWFPSQFQLLMMWKSMAFPSIRRHLPLSTLHHHRSQRRRQNHPVNQPRLPSHYSREMSKTRLSESSESKTQWKKTLWNNPLYRPRLCLMKLNPIWTPPVKNSRQWTPGLNSNEPDQSQIKITSL